MKRKLSMVVFGGIAAVALTVYAAGGSKKTAETCTDDNECSRGHCYTKQDGNKVCVDCSPSNISDYRGQVQRFCKEEPRGCTSIPATDEASEQYFTIRLENGERCIRARDSENRACWNGGDDGHQRAVEEAERTRKNCYSELNSRQGNGGIYTCSDSTYATRSKEADDRCKEYGKACEAWNKDDKQVNCTDIENEMKKPGLCVEAVERLDSDCLPRLSSRREGQFGRAKKAYDYCKEVLDYKKDKKLCK